MVMAAAAAGRAHGFTACRERGGGSQLPGSLQEGLAPPESCQGTAAGNLYHFEPVKHVSGGRNSVFFTMPN